MRQLTQLQRVAGVLATVRDIAYETRRYTFITPQPVTFYLDAEQATVHLRRHAEPKINVRVRFQAGFGWRVRTEQDDDGVYIVIKRRALVGQVAQAQFNVAVPHDAHVALKIDGGALLIEQLTGLVELPAAVQGVPLRLEAGTDTP